MQVAGDGGWETGFRWDAKRLLLDPYAPLVSSRRVFGKRDELEHFKPKVRPVLAPSSPTMTLM